MGGWNTRLWRRVRIAPGLSINLSKSGPSVSVGPRGAKMTFGRRGIRQTVGLPGTGLYATRQVAATASRTAERKVAAAGDPAAAADTPAARPAPVGSAMDPAADQIELYYGFASIVGIVFGLALLAMGLPAGTALTGGVLAIVAGIAYEGLAHHHPGPAKAIAQLIVGLVSIATAIGAVLLVGLAVGAAASLRSSGRRRG